MKSCRIEEVSRAEIDIPIQDLRDVCHLSADPSRDAQLTEFCHAAESEVGAIINRDVRPKTVREFYPSNAGKFDLQLKPESDLSIGVYGEDRSITRTNIQIDSSDTRSDFSTNHIYDETGNRVVTINSYVPTTSNDIEFPVFIEYVKTDLSTDEVILSAIKTLVRLKYGLRFNQPIDETATRNDVRIMLYPFLNFGETQ